MDVNDSCRLCFGNLRIDGKLCVLASWEQHSAGVLRHRHERPPPFAPTNLSLLWLARTRSYRCKHSTEDKGQTIGVEPSLAEARRMAREAICFVHVWSNSSLTGCKLVKLVKLDAITINESIVETRVPTLSELPQPWTFCSHFPSSYKNIMFMCILAKFWSRIYH